jgi:hypothetical protein
MLTDRERRLLAQIEAHLHRDEPGLARLLRHGSPRRDVRRTLHVPRPAPARLLALIFTAITVMFGSVLFGIGMVFNSTELIAVALPIAIVLPLPVWLLTTSRRWIDTFGLVA